MANHNKLLIKKEIANFLREIYIIQHDAKSNYLCSRFLYKNGYDKNSQIQYKLIQTVCISISLNKLYVIQLDMLYNQNQEYSFYSFFTGLNNDAARALGFTHKLIKEWKAKLKAVKKTTDNVNTLRNKLYAHRSENLDDYYHIYTDLDDLNKLLLIGEEIIVEAYKVIGENVQITKWFYDTLFVTELRKLTDAPVYE